MYHLSTDVSQSYFSLLLESDVLGSVYTLVENHSPATMQVIYMEDKLLMGRTDTMEDDIRKTLP